MAAVNAQPPTLRRVQNVLRDRYGIRTSHQRGREGYRITEIGEVVHIVVDFDNTVQAEHTARDLADSLRTDTDWAVETEGNRVLVSAEE